MIVPLRPLALALGLCVAALPARACQTALLLAIDVSQSIDAAEYRFQTEGLAEALADPQIAEALVRGRMALAVMQWSGLESQQMSIPWTRMHSAADLAAFAERARTMPRAYLMSNTAVGQALTHAMAQFDDVPDCARKVIDLSGDGPDNAGSDPRRARNLAERAGIEINGLAIESLGLSITTYFRRSVITRGGFVMTARGYRSYARTLRDKIRRETAQIMF
jgi:Ca-activated chloride channel family protein